MENQIKRTMIVYDSGMNIISEYSIYLSQEEVKQEMLSQICKKFKIEQICALNFYNDHEGFVLQVLAIDKSVTGTVKLIDWN